MHVWEIIWAVEKAMRFVVDGGVVVEDTKGGIVQ